MKVIAISILLLFLFLPMVVKAAVYNVVTTNAEEVEINDLLAVVNASRAA